MEFRVEGLAEQLTEATANNTRGLNIKTLTDARSTFMLFSVTQSLIRDYKNTSWCSGQNANLQFDSKMSVMDTTRTLNAFLCIPLLSMGLMKAFSLISNLAPNKNLQLKICFILSVASLIIGITVLALILHLPELRCGGDSIPGFYVPLGLSTVFPGIFEVRFTVNRLGCC